MKRRLLTRMLSIALAFTILSSDISVHAASEVMGESTSTETQTEEGLFEENQETEENTEEPVAEESELQTEEQVTDEPVTEEKVPEETTAETETVPENEAPVEEIPETKEKTIVKDEVASVYYLVPETETSAIAMDMYSLEDGNVSLKSDVGIDWIDRLDLTNAEEIKDFYDLLVEASDNDDIDDFLIDDNIFASDYNLTVKEVTKSIEVQISDATNEDTVSGEIKAAVGELAATICENYSPYMIAARDAFDRDHPEVFWLSGTTALGYSLEYGYEPPKLTNKTVTVNYTVSLYMVLKGTVDGEAFDIRATNYRSQTAIKNAIISVDSACEEILSGASAFTDYEKVKYFNEILTTTNEYNTSENLDAIDHDCRECISALEGNTGTEGPVCEGYARALKVLCDKALIPCVLVDGMACIDSFTEGEAHMWNYVQLEEQWYGVDVVWNDPVGGDGAVSGYENKEWLLVGAGSIVSGMTFADSHPVENRVSAGGVAFTNGPELCTEAYVHSEEPETFGYNVTLNANGGTINSENITEYDGTVEITLPTDVTKEGYTFEGWYERETFEGERVTEIPVGSEGDKSFHAKWKIIQVYTDRILKDNGEPYTGYFKYDDKKYYANANGILQSGWIKNGAVWRYFNETGGFYEIPGTTKDGCLYILENGSISYFTNRTTLVKNGWKTISGFRYHFDSDGFADTGFFQDGRYYYYAETVETATESSPIGNVVKGVKAIDGKIYGFHISQYYRLTGWQTLGDQRYYFKDDCTAVIGWYQEGNYWCYADENGCMVKGEQQIGGQTYYFDNNYRLTTGWVKINNQWRFFDQADNYLQCCELQYTGYDGTASDWAVFSDGHKSYIHTKKGVLKGWQTIDGQRYYFDSTGIMETGEFKVGNYWYYGEPKAADTEVQTIPEGAAAKGIKVIGEDTYCFHSTGYYRLTGWQTIDKKRFFLGTDGKAQTGWIESGGRKYYAEPETVGDVLKGTIVSGAKTIGTATYVFHPSRYYLLTGWQIVNGQRYYIQENGSVVKGWYQEGDYWYYADENGCMTKGLTNIGEKQYYFDNNYRLSTGWKRIGNKMHFFDSVAENPVACCEITYDGALGGWITLEDGRKSYIKANYQVLTGWQTIDRKRYYFDGTGIMQTGLFQNGRYYYYAEETGENQGAIAKGAKIIGGKIYGFHPTKYYRLTGWQTLDGQRYYFKDDCTAVIGWYQEGNYWYYADENGCMVKGECQIDGQTYYFDNNYRLTTGWIKLGTEWKFFNNADSAEDCYELTDNGAVSGWIALSNGKKSYIHTKKGILKGWQTIDNARYYFDSMGIMQTNWFKEGKYWYYADEEGRVQRGLVELVADTIDRSYYFDINYRLKTGWVTISGIRYHFSGAEKPENCYAIYSGNINKGWFLFEGKKSYFNNSLNAVTGWQTIDSKRYYFDTNGIMQTGWFRIGNYWYYANSDGTMVNGLIELAVGEENKIYYFDQNYRQKTGWQTIGGRKYFFETSENPEECYATRIGAVLDTGWLTLENGQICYVNKKGVILTGWQTIDKQRYYFDTNGILQIGWFYVGNHRYYGEEKETEGQKQRIPVGAVAKGAKEIGGETYFFHSSQCYRLTGFQSYNGKRYYLQPDGTAKTGWFTVGTDLYYGEPATAAGGELKGTLAKGAKEINGETYFFHTSSNYRLTGWQTVNGQRYYLDMEGTAKTGWFTVGGKIYYGEPATTSSILKGTLGKGVKVINGETYCFHPNSYYRLTGWQTMNGQRFYLDTDGKARTGWFEVSGYHHYANTDGTIAKGLVELSYGNSGEKKTYYFDGNYQLKTGWQTISNKKYFFENSENPEECYATTIATVLDTGWLTLKNGQICYANNRGSILKGWQTIDKQRYYFDANGVLQIGWFYVGNNRYYGEEKAAEDEEQTIPVGAVAKGVKVINGETYCFHASRYYMLKGWQTVNGQRFYLNNEGIAQTGWQTIGGKTYFGERTTHDGIYKGTIARGAREIDGETYFFHSSQYYRLTGFQSYNGKRYYLQLDGTAKTGWFAVGTDLYYGEPATTADGELKGTLVRGAKEIDGETYFFHTSSNYRLTGWQTIDTKRFYLQSDGKAKAGWFKQGGYWYYGQENVKSDNDLKGMMQKGLRKITVLDSEKVIERTYYFDNSYRLETGWKTINKEKYFFNTDEKPENCYMVYCGAVSTGWFLLEDGRKSYFNSQRNALTGWQTISGKKYYFDSNGIMQTGWCTINGTEYFFNADGIYIPLTTPTFAAVTSTFYRTVDVKWNRVDGVQNYTLEYSADPVFPSWETTSILIKDTTVNEYRVEDLESDTTYYFRLRYTVWGGNEENPEVLHSQYSSVKSIIVKGEAAATATSATISECQITSGSRTGGMTVQIQAELNERLKSADDKYYIVETESYGNAIDLAVPVGVVDKAFEIDTEVTIDQGDGSDAVKECVDRALMNKFALAILKEDGTYQVISAPMGITNPEFVSENKAPVFKAVSKKGIQGSFYASDTQFDMVNAKDQNTKQTLINLNLADLVGTADDSRCREYVYKGKTYYFSKCEAEIASIRSLNSGFEEYMHGYSDNKQGQNRKIGVAVTVCLLLGYNSSNSYLIDPAARTKGHLYYTLNVREERARETFEALFCYLGDIFGQSDCYVTNWVLGNEVNSSRAWNYQGSLSQDDYMKCYAAAFRLLYNGVKASKTGNNVFISLDNGWTAAPNTYSGKSILDKFAAYAQNENEDMLWSIAYHGYSYPLTRCDFWNDNSNTTFSTSTRYISMKNISVLINYANTLEDKYDKPSGSIRIILSEQGYNAGQGAEIQARALARGYYMAEFEERIDAFIIRAIIDAREEMNGGLYLGIRSYDERKRISFYVYEFMDSDLDAFRTTSVDIISSPENYSKVQKAKDILCGTNWESMIPGFDRSRLAGMY